MTKRATLEDVARIVGVSARTVSLALNNQGRISRATRERVQKAARELNYHPNITAKGLRLNRSYLIAAVFPYLDISFFSHIIGGVEKECFENEFDLLVANSLVNNPDRLSAQELVRAEEGVLHRLLARKVDGIMATVDPLNRAVYERILETGTPFLQVMTSLPGLAAPSLGVDNEKGGTIATQHLIDLGHRRIGFLDTSSEHYTEIRLRFQGYLKTLLANGIHQGLDDTVVKAGNLLDAEEARDAARLLLTQPRRVTAIFAPTDYAALGAMRACLERGLEVPRDVSVVGYDDLDIARCQIDHPLTTVAQPKQELGRIAFRMLHGLITRTPVENRLIEPALVVRTTTGPARS